MAVKILEHQRCRHYRIEVDEKACELHFALQFEFIDRGVQSPRGDACAPAKRKGWRRLTFLLAEEVCDEYERRMGLRIGASQPEAEAPGTGTKAA